MTQQPPDTLLASILPRAVRVVVVDNQVGLSGAADGTPAALALDHRPVFGDVEPVIPLNGALSLVRLG